MVCAVALLGMLALGAASRAAQPGATASRAAQPGATASRAAQLGPRGYSFAPYTDMADYPPPDLGAFKAKARVKHVSLGFITAEGGSKCAPTWGGYADYPAVGSKAYRLAQVRAYNRGSADAVPSFGGQAGTELALVCDSVPELANAYNGVIKTYGATHIDFDIEGTAVTDRAANTRRAKAIALLQRAARTHHRKLVVSFTLPVLPTGLDSAGLAIVRGAGAKGVRVSIVNGMAMDYGEAAAPDPAGKMGAYAIDVAKSLERQLGKIYPRASTSQVRRAVGITPMIGVSDVASEITTLADARQIVAYAKSRHLGMLGMWQLGRDRECDSPSTTTQLDCSGVPQGPWAFAKALGAFRG